MKIIYPSTRHAIFLLYFCLFSFIESSSSIVLPCPKFIKILVHRIRSHIPFGKKSKHRTNESSSIDIESIEEMSFSTETKNNDFVSSFQCDDTNSKELNNRILDSTVSSIRDDLFHDMDGELNSMNDRKKVDKEVSMFDKEKVLFEGFIEDLSLEKYLSIGWMDIQFLVNHLSETGEKNIKVGSWRSIHNSVDNEKIYNSNHQKERESNIFPDEIMHNSNIFKETQGSKNNAFQKISSSIVGKFKRKMVKRDNGRNYGSMETLDPIPKCKSVIHFLSERRITSEHPVRLSVPGIKVDPFVESEKHQRIAFVTSTFEDESNNGRPSFHCETKSEKSSGGRKKSSSKNNLTSLTVIEVNQVKNIPYAENYDVLTVFRATWIHDNMPSVETLRNLGKIIDGQKLNEKECRIKQKNQIHLKITQKVRVKKSFIFESFVQRAAFEEGKSTATLWANNLLSQVDNNSFQLIESNKGRINEHFGIIESCYHELNTRNIIFAVSCIAKKDINILPISVLSSEAKSTTTDSTAYDETKNSSEEDIEYIALAAQGFKYVALAALGVVTGIVSITCLPRFIGKLPFGF